MFRLLAPTAALTLLLLAPSMRAEEPPTNPKTFEQLKTEGDRAMGAGRLNDAIEAYNKALDFKLDPLVAGRLGLALMMFDDPKLRVAAASMLEIAVSDVAGDSAAERRTLFNAYERVRRHVCKLEVTTNDVDSDVDTGNGKFRRSEGAFWTFVGPGKHVSIGRLKGREDIRTPYECVNGKTVKIHVEFPRPPEPKPKTITVIAPGKETTVFVREQAKSPAPATPTDRQRYGFVMGAVGPVVVLGASPSPALGAGMSITYRYRNVSGLLTARGAWALGDVAGAPIDVFAFGALGGPCAHLDWFSACVLASVNAFRYETSVNRAYKRATIGALIPGAGLGIAGRYHLWKSLGLRLSADLTVLTRELAIADRTNGTVLSLWDGGQFLVGASVALTYDK